jgi:hypothetical protein
MFSYPTAVGCKRFHRSLKDALRARCTAANWVDLLPWVLLGLHAEAPPQVRSRMATKYGRSNGSFHRVLACSAGGPGFDSRLRHNILRCSMQKDVDGSGQPLHSGDPDVPPVFTSLHKLLKRSTITGSEPLYHSSNPAPPPPHLI